MNHWPAVAICTSALVAAVSSGCQPAPTPTPAAPPTAPPTVVAELAPTMVEPTEVPGQRAVCWSGRISSLPEGAEYDDFLALVPEEAGEMGVVGATEELEAEIAALREREDPEGTVHLWGTVFCDVADVAGCRMRVDRLRTAEEGASAKVDPVDGWEGVLKTVPDEEAVSGGDDYFELAGDFPVRFGITSADDAIAEQLAGLRDSRIVVRVWGEIACGAPDAYGAQIRVSRIE